MLWSPSGDRDPTTITNQTIEMKICIQALSLLAIASSLSFGEEAPAKPEKPKDHNPEAIFKKLDTNADGSISLDEFKASPRAQKDPAKAEEIFKKMDADASGGVSLDEFKAAGPPKGGKGGKGGEGGKAPK